MINAKKIMRTLVEDLVQPYSRAERDALRSILTRYLPHETPTLDDLKNLMTLEVLVTRDAQGITQKCAEEVLFFSRFLRKVDIGMTLKDRDEQIAEFVNRQSSVDLSVPGDDFIINGARKIMRLILTDRPRIQPKYRHGPGLSSDSERGLDKSSVPVHFIDNDLDPLKRLRYEELSSPKGTKICLVPKDWRAKRIIGQEPVWNMCRQLGLKSQLEWHSSHFVPYSDQGRQRLMLSRSFVYPIATVDLSNASDHISVSLAREIIPSGWFELLAACRTDAYDVSGEHRRTGSFALMGNGFCFPILSLSVLSIAIASFCHTTGRDLPQDLCDLARFQHVFGIQTFGDDLTFPVVAFDNLVSDMTRAGLVVNDSKCGTGYFRETCGVYQFYGRRPFSCQYLRSLEWSSCSAIGLTTLVSELEKFGYLRTSKALSESAPSQVLAHLSRPASVFKRYQVVREPCLSLKSREREVNLSDYSGWFAAFHGGIPVKEPVGPLRSVFSFRCV